MAIKQSLYEEYTLVRKSSLFTQRMFLSLVVCQLRLYAQNVATIAEMENPISV